MSDADVTRRMRDDWDRRARTAARLYVATWDAHSDAGWEAGIRRDTAELLAHLPPGFGPGQACLDLGCGVGRLLPALASRFDRVVGCDVSPEMIARARAVAAPGVELLLIDGRSLAPLRDGEMAFVLANAVFIHLPAQTLGSLLREVARVLRPGGVLAATFNALEPEEAGPTPVLRPANPCPTTDPRPAPAPGALAPSGEELALMGGPTWDGERFREPELRLLLEESGFVLTGLQAQASMWAAMARRR